MVVTCVCVYVCVCVCVCVCLCVYMCVYECVLGGGRCGDISIPSISADHNTYAWPEKELRMPSSALDDTDVETLQERVDNLSQKLQESETRSAELKVVWVRVVVIVSYVT